MWVRVPPDAPFLCYRNALTAEPNTANFRFFGYPTIVGRRWAANRETIYALTV